MRVAVFGSSATPPDSPCAAAAEELGRRLAAMGCVVMNGGYGGTMEAVSRGAAAAGGRVVGVTCRSFRGRSPNPWLSEERPAEDLLARLRILIREPDAWVVLDGGVGTLAELFLAWNVALMETPRPLIVVGEGLRSAVEGLAAHTELTPERLARVTFVEDAAGAAAVVERLATS